MSGRRARESTWRRTVRIVLSLWRAEVARAAGYRGDLLLGLLVNTLWLAATVAPVLFVFGTGSATGAIGDDWTLGELLYLQAVWWLLDAVLWMLIIPNLSMLSTDVAEGQLDMVLLKPVNSMIYVSNKRLEVLDVIKLPMAASLGVYALLRADTEVGLLGLVSGGVALVSAAVLVWAIGVLANVKALTAVRFEAGWLAVGIHNLSRAPVSFYGPALRFFLTALVPVAFLTTVPAEVVFGERPWWWAAIAVAVAAVTVAVTSAAWNHQVRRYSGAMS